MKIIYGTLPIRNSWVDALVVVIEYFRLLHVTSSYVMPANDCTLFSSQLVGPFRKASCSFKEECNNEMMIFLTDNTVRVLRSTLPIARSYEHITLVLH